MNRTNIMVEFCIIGEDFNPDLITDKLRIEPDETYIKGDKIRGKLIRKETNWSISTGYVETLYLTELFDNLLSRLSNKKEEISRLKDEYKLQCKFFVAINIENDEKPAIYINKQIIEFANFLEAEFDFDMYIFN